MGLSEVMKLKKSLLDMSRAGGRRKCNGEQKAVQTLCQILARPAIFLLSANPLLPDGGTFNPTPRAVQWAYLFERFPSFTQTFCYREVAEIMRQGLSPWIYSIRRPKDEPGQDFTRELTGQVRYLPEEGELFTEFRWLIRTHRLHPNLQAVALSLKGTHDYGRVQEAGWLGGQMSDAGIGHVHAHFAGLAARTAYWLQRYYGIGYSFTAHANDVFCPPDPSLSVTLEELIWRAKFVVTVSDFSAALLKKRFPLSARKIHRVYNGIDTGDFPHARPEKKSTAHRVRGAVHREKGLRRPHRRLRGVAGPGRGV